MQANDIIGLMPLLIVIAVAWFFIRRSKMKSANNTMPPSPQPNSSNHDKSPSIGGLFERICWVGAAIGSVVATFKLLDLAMVSTLSAPQYAALAAGACAWAVVPYVFARAVQGFRAA